MPFWQLGVDDDCDYHSREISHFVGNKSERHCVHHYVDVYLSTPDKLPVASSVKPDSFPGDLPEDPVPPFDFFLFVK